MGMELSRAGGAGVGGCWGVSRGGLSRVNVKGRKMGVARMANWESTTRSPSSSRRPVFL